MLPRPYFLLVVLMAVMPLAGCVTRSRGGLPPPMQGIMVEEPLRPILQQMDRDGERNWVKHLNELAVAAMVRGDHDLAASALDEAILHINAVFGITPESRRARQIFFDEDVRLFKGESYERAMTYFYRGVLFMQDGNFNNARALFRGAAFQDTFAEEEQFRNDWVIFDYLIAVSELRLGRQIAAENAFRFAQTNFAAFPESYRIALGERLPITGEELQFPNRDANLLIIVQDGLGPQKVRVGQFGQFLGIVRRQSRFRPTTIQIGDESPRRALVVDSVTFQAMTRGGRPVDKWNRRKAVFRGATETTGDISLTAGSILFASANNEQQAIVGLALIGTGVALTVLSNVARSGADIRQWGTLPDTLSIYARQLPAGPHIVRIQSSAISSSEFTVTLPEPGQGLVTVLTFGNDAPGILLPRNQP